MTLKQTQAVSLPHLDNIDGFIFNENVEPINNINSKLLNGSGDSSEDSDSETDNSNNKVNYLNVTAKLIVC